MSAARHHRANRGLLAQHSLPLVEPGAPLETLETPLPRCQRLWFCIYLPKLPLEASGPVDEARVVVEDQQGIHRVLLASHEAQAAGIQPGQSANAALVLLPSLRIEERCRLAEQQALENLAAWLERFTSVVCIAGPDALLLEIAGSLRLFGGLRDLRERIAAGLEQQGFRTSLAIAPTPLAATWLAKSGQRRCIREPANLASALRSLPLACLDWPVSVCESLAGMGIKDIGDCLRLPREGFARRFGPERLLDIDRALGRLPDPRTGWRVPERFCADFEMTEERSDRELLLAICRELLASLERFLLTRQLGVQDLLFSFFHLRGAATQLRLGSAGAERLAEHWFDLLRIRFERLALPEPVIAVRLRGGRTQALRAESGRFRFQGREGRQGLQFSMTQLAERLVARIGRQSVIGVTTVAEHRPQLAWCAQGILTMKQAGASGAGERVLRRPLWMLPEPALLPAEQGYPWHRGRLTLLEGPERLETGWWDEDGITRDYYTAVNPQGMHLWVYRNRRHEASWYLHGFFG